MDAQISIPAELKERIEREADARGMSLPEFMRASIEWAIAQESPDDALFSDSAVYRDDGPNDFASKHDDHLYGDDS